VFLCQVIWFIIIYTSDIMKTFERIDKDKDKKVECLLYNDTS